MCVLRGGGGLWFVDMRPGSEKKGGGWDRLRYSFFALLFGLLRSMDVCEMWC